MIENKHRVAPSLWRNCSEQARRLFNDVYEDVRRVGQLCFLHPATGRRRISDAEFDTIAWNAAWTVMHLLDHPGDLTDSVETVESHEIERHPGECACRAA